MCSRAGTMAVWAVVSMVALAAKPGSRDTCTS
jgi:hypothetical protein